MILEVVYRLISAKVPLSVDRCIGVIPLPSGIMNGSFAEPYLFAAAHGLKESTAGRKISLPCAFPWCPVHHMLWALLGCCTSC